ncbi:hypothetical protein, conserved [Eimeria maxima]|uniref:Uncharacterized protein n=1 Tax=Eimeria maxima TaxID=5804 RepID=U6MER3_EIMMA|nr:hypothetical protein, conserved [Eimeria maxima]CDJ60150.1 hypothetical protein, conserved [Eimeria maxima]
MGTFSLLSSCMHSHNAVGIRLGSRLINPSNNYTKRFFSTEGGRLLNPNPRPTQYQTVIVNEAVNPPPGREVSLTPFLVGAGVFMVIFPCIQTTMELRNYYKKTEHLYRDGWNRHHYDDMKNEYLS